VAARAAGVRLGLEAIHHTVLSINSISRAMELLKDSGVDDLGIMADTYNLWNEKPADLAAIAMSGEGLHVADVPNEPPTGFSPLKAASTQRSLHLLHRSGLEWYPDVEIFSTRSFLGPVG
jgi:sugar phosphate isomerase/epimerase